jgi:hypothetical protein
MARYLLIVNNRFYPRAGTGDWVGSYDTWEKAEEVGKAFLVDEYKSYTVVDLLDLVNQPEGEKVEQE